MRKLYPAQNTRGILTSLRGRGPTGALSQSLNPTPRTTDNSAARMSPPSLPRRAGCYGTAKTHGESKAVLFVLTLTSNDIVRWMSALRAPCFVVLRGRDRCSWDSIFSIRFLSRLSLRLRDDPHVLLSVRINPVASRPRRGSRAPLGCTLPLYGQPASGEGKQ